MQFGFGDKHFHGLGCEIDIRRHKVNFKHTWNCLRHNSAKHKQRWNGESTANKKKQDDIHTTITGAERWVALILPENGLVWRPSDSRRINTTVGDVSETLRNRKSHIQHHPKAWETAASEIREFVTHEQKKNDRDYVQWFVRNVDFQSGGMSVGWNCPVLNGAAGCDFGLTNEAMARPNPDKPSNTQFEQHLSHDVWCVGAVWKWYDGHGQPEIRARKDNLGIHCMKLRWLLCDGR
jgi:hypothetical protein